MVLGYNAQEWNEDGGFEELPAVTVAPAVSAAPALSAASAVSAAPVAPAPKGKDKAEWSMLLPQEMQAATMLDYNPAYWDNGVTPETTALPWSALPPQLRAAAMVLGYNAQEWNEDGGFEEELTTSMPTTTAPLPTPLPLPLPLPVPVPVPAATATTSTAAAATSFPIGVATAPPLPAPPPHAAPQGPKGKDKERWAELNPEEMRAAATLGFDAALWENGMTPDTIALPWSALPPQLRAAAMVLDYTAREWNEDGGFDDEAP